MKPPTAVRKLCDVCRVLTLPALVAAYAAGVRGIDFCGPAHYGPLAVGISLLAFLLLLVEAEYLLRCFSEDRDLMTLPKVFWGAMLVPLVLALVDVTGFWTVLVLLPWCPLETLAPEEHCCIY